VHSKLGPKSKTLTLQTSEKIKKSITLAFTFHPTFFGNPMLVPSSKLMTSFVLNMTSIPLWHPKALEVFCKKSTCNKFENCLEFFLGYFKET
jgi:hypothetical protein